MSIEVGDEAPQFQLQDESGNTVSLEDYRGRPLIIYFYPKADTPGCTTQACDFRDRYQRFQAMGYQILGISPDKVPALAKFRKKYDLPFPVLSDPDHTVAAAFGAWGTKKNYGREYEGLIRSTFEVDPAGKVVTAWRNVRAKGHADRILEQVGATE